MQVELVEGFAGQVAVADGHGSGLAVDVDVAEGDRRRLGGVGTFGGGGGGVVWFRDLQVFRITSMNAFGLTISSPAYWRNYRRPLSPVIRYSARASLAVAST
jgi:hypothetical protein